MKLIWIGLAVTLISAVNVSAGLQRIINGDLLPISGAPYTMQLRSTRDITLCGATLVHPEFVITAAHCLDKLKDEEIVIVGGATTVNESGVKRRIVKRFVHSGYRLINKDNDVAVLKLDAPMTGKYIAEIPLCSKSLQKGDVIQVSGWGRTSEKGYSSDDLRTVFLTIITKDQCVNMHKQKKISIKIADSQVCAYDGGVKDSCRGDSGGPAVHNGELCGVVSWGMGCGREGYPGMYTSIDAVRDFINESMSQ